MCSRLGRRERPISAESPGRRGHVEPESLGTPRGQYQLLDELGARAAADEDRDEPAASRTRIGPRHRVYRPGSEVHRGAYTTGADESGGEPQTRSKNTGIGSFADRSWASDSSGKRAQYSPGFQPKPGRSDSPVEHEIA